MKVGFIIPNLLPYGGNSATVLKYISSSVRECDEVILFQSFKFSSSKQYPLDYLQSLGNVRVVSLSIPWYKVVDATRNIPFGFLIHYSLYPIFVFLRKVFNYSRLKRASDLDGIYSFDFIDSNIFPGKNLPIIVGTHNQKMGYFKVIAVNHGILLRKSSGIRLFESEKQYDGKFTHKISKVIPKGVNTELFYPRKEGVNSKIRFLYVARLEPRKGLNILLDAWEEAEAWDFAELNIVGTGSLSNLAEETKLKGVVYHGPLYDNDLQSLYRGCDVFIFPTQWDAQPSVIVEAVSSGLMTLCSDHLKGAFDDLEKEGFLKYIENNSKSLSTSIKFLKTNKFDDFYFRTRMHEFIENNRSQQKEVEKILDFIKELKVEN